MDGFVSVLLYLAVGSFASNKTTDVKLQYLDPQIKSLTRKLRLRNWKGRISTVMFLESRAAVAFSSAL